MIAHSSWLTSPALQSQLEEAQNEKYALSEEKGRMALQIEQLKVPA